MKSFLVEKEFDLNQFDRLTLILVCVDFRLENKGSTIKWKILIWRTKESTRWMWMAISSKLTTFHRIFIVIRINGNHPTGSNRINFVRVLFIHRLNFEGSLWIEVCNWARSSFMDSTWTIPLQVRFSQTVQINSHVVDFSSRNNVHVGRVLWPKSYFFPSFILQMK